MRSTGFPGYELLNKIGMIRFITPNICLTQKIEFNIHKDECVLCCFEYTDLVKCKTTDDLINVKVNKRYSLFNDDTKLIHTFKSECVIRHPLKIMCCGIII